MPIRLRQSTSFWLERRPRGCGIEAEGIGEKSPPRLVFSRVFQDVFFRVRWINFFRSCPGCRSTPECRSSMDCEGGGARLKGAHAPSGPFRYSDRLYFYSIFKEQVRDLNQEATRDRKLQAGWSFPLCR